MFSKTEIAQNFSGGQIRPTLSYYLIKSGVQKSRFFISAPFEKIKSGEFFSVKIFVVVEAIGRAATEPRKNEQKEF